MDEQRIRVLVAEDDSDFAYLIGEMLAAQPDMACVGYAKTADEAVYLARALRPDIVLMDLNLSMSRLDGIDAAKDIRLSTDARVIILTVFESPEIVIDASKKAFASGYVFKSQFQILPQTIRGTAIGKMPQEYMIQRLLIDMLSPAEKSIFEIMLGKKIELFSSQKTIANQKTNILRKLGLKNQRELIKIFGEHQ